jgi:hypothetical protein
MERKLDIFRCALNKKQLQSGTAALLRIGGTYRIHHGLRF